MFVCHVALHCYSVVGHFLNESRKPDEEGVTVSILTDIRARSRIGVSRKPPETQFPAFQRGWLYIRAIFSLRTESAGASPHIFVQSCAAWETSSACVSGKPSKCNFTINSAQNSSHLYCGRRPPGPLIGPNALPWSGEDDSGRGNRSISSLVRTVT